MQIKTPEALCKVFGVDHVENIGEVNDYNVVGVGPGLGPFESHVKLLEKLFRSKKQLVLDADALYAVAGHNELLAAAGGLAVLTPHPGEMARLTGLSVKQIQTDRLGAARRAAAEWNSIVVLKGSRTVVAFPDGELYLNPTGNPGMATGGTGDVLAGMIAALIAQGLSSHDAAVLGVYLHGVAGDLAASGRPVGMTALDLAEQVPAAIYSLVI